MNARWMLTLARAQLRDAMAARARLRAGVRCWLALDGAWLLLRVWKTNSVVNPARYWAGLNVNGPGRAGPGLLDVGDEFETGGKIFFNKLNIFRYKVVGFFGEIF